MSNEKRRENDVQLADHEIRLIKVEHDLGRLMDHHKADNLLQRISILEGAIELAYEKIRGYEEILTHLKGDKANAFTDAQVKWLKDFHEEREQVDAGRAFLRILWAAGLGAASALLAYLGIKGH